MAIQRSLSAPPSGGGVRLRIGLHTGEGEIGGGGDLGLDVNKAARVAATANGGQFVLSSTTALLVADHTEEALELAVTAFKESLAELR